MELGPEGELVCHQSPAIALATAAPPLLLPPPPPPRGR